MKRLAAWTTVSFVIALVATGCQTPAPASDCDGWERLSPSAETRSFIIQSDRPFATSVAAHNRHGANRGCWK